MSVATELTRIQTAKADIKASIEAKGVTVPSSALIDEYADYVDEIQTGGGGGQAEQDLINLIERDITSITIPSGTTTIGQSAFQGCSALTSVTIPDSVTSIGDSAFQGCNHLTNITIPSGVTSIGQYSFQGCSALTSINIPSGVTSIEYNAFQGCSALTSINIPSGVTSIGQYSFQNCSGLTSINIPSGVTSISNSAFNGCRSLTSVTVNATTPPTLGSSVFNNTNDCPIYVPAESVETYKAASRWSSYADRIQAIP